jgi:hypothetical protein
MTPPAVGRLNSYGTSVRIDCLAFISDIPPSATPGLELVILDLTTSRDQNTVAAQVPVA